MATPDVRVRLSAEGVQDVLKALQRVQLEAQKTRAKTAGVGRGANSGASGFLAFNKVLRSTRGLLGGLGVVTGVAGLTRLFSTGSQAAREFGFLAESLGTTAENMVGISLAAQSVDLDMSTLNIKIGKFAERLSDLKAGVPDAVDDFARLGFTAADFPVDDTVKNFETTLKALGRLEDGYEKTTLVAELFGRVGTKDAALIPLANRLAQEGAFPLRKQVGSLFNAKTIRAAQNLNSQVGLLSTQIKGLTVSFTSGLAASADRGLESVSEAIGGESSGVAKALAFLGKVAGKVFLVVTNAISGMITVAEIGVSSIIAVGRAQLAFLSGNAGQAGQILLEEFNKNNKLAKDAVERAQKNLAALFDEPTDVFGQSPEGREQAAREAIAEYERQSKLIELVIKGSSERMRRQLQFQDEQLRDQYERGLLSLTELFERRRENLKRETGLEVKALQEQLALLRGAPDTEQNRQRINTLEGKLGQAVLTQRLVEEVGQFHLTKELQGEIERLNEATADQAERRAEAEGDVLASQRRQLEVRMEARRIDLAQEGGRTPTEIDAQIEREFGSEAKKLKIDELQVEATRKELDLSREIRDIYQLVVDDKITEEEATQRVIALEGRRIPQLEKIGKLALKISEDLGNEDFIQIWKDFLTRLGEARTRVASTQAEIRAAFQFGLVDTLSAAGHELDTLGKIWDSFVNNVVRGIQRIFAERLAKQLISAIPLFATGGEIPGKASGGVIEGPGTGTSDSILARVSKGEFVVRAASVRKPGMLDLLNRINYGKLPRITADDYRRATRQPNPYIPRYAGGGVVGDPGITVPEGGGSTVGGKITIELAPGLMAKQILTPSGQKAVIQVVQKNARMMGDILDR